MPGPFFCVPSMFDSSRVKVLLQSDGGEVIAKRKDVDVQESDRRNRQV